MFLLLLANRFKKISLNALELVFHCFSKVTWEIETAVLKPYMGATGGFSKAYWGVYTDFREILVKLFLAPMQL